MFRYNMYALFPSAALDLGRLYLKHIAPTTNGPKSAPDGSYWVAYEPDYRHDDNNVLGDALSRLRPALLDTDDVHFDNNLNMRTADPSEYAKRWGLHEDAPPGRSRTSLTRSDTRIFRKPGSEESVTGKKLANYFESKALENNMDVDEWLAQSLPRDGLHKDDKAYLAWLDDLQKDEVWQGMLFNDFTMDELHEDDVFTMRDDLPKCDIRGSLHPLLDRENWVAPTVDSGFGVAQNEPRWFYLAGDKEGEYDPTNNDELWDAMRPALLLVSRVLKEKPEFLNAILRIWDYKIVPPQRDTRPYKPEPLKTFDIIQCSPNDPAVLPEVQFLRPIGDKYVSALWKVLARNLRLHIHGNMTACGVTGSSFMDINDRKKTPYIFIVLNANMIFPLLVPGYSQSEKIMSSFYVASTILHELAHAFYMMAKISMFRPDELPQSVAPKRDHWKFHDGARNFFGSSRSEPYFRHEPVSELGYSFENWLFGGAASPLTNANHRVIARGLVWQSVALRSERFPFYRCLNSGGFDKNQGRYGGAILDFPVFDTESLYTNNSVHAVAPYFSQSFWMNPVKVYGLKALKMHAANHKIKATMALFENKSSNCSEFYIGLQHVRDRIEGLLTSLTANGFLVASNYLSALIVERIRTQIGIMRWETQDKCFQSRGKRAARNLWKAHTIALETRICNVLLKLKAKNSPQHVMEAFATESYIRWERYVCQLPGGKPPQGSEALAGDGEHGFIRELEGVVRQTNCRRYLACLPDVSAYLTEELQHMENAIFEAYMMEERDMQYMLSHFRQRWLNNFDYLTKIVRDFVVHMSLFREQNKDIDTWLTRFLEMSKHLTALRQYLTTDKKKEDPVAWRHMFLSIGKGSAARKTPSKNWANLVREQLCKMDGSIRAEFEAVVGILMAGSGTQAPHTLAKTFMEKYGGAGQHGGTAASPEAPGDPMDLVYDQGGDEAVTAAQALMTLAQDPNFNPNDRQSLHDIAQMAHEQAGRRRETRQEIQELQAQLKLIRYEKQNEDALHQAQEAVRHAQQERAKLERQIAGLHQLQHQHHQLHNYEGIHADLNVLQGMLVEMLDETNLRAMYASKILEDPAVAKKREWEQRLLETEIQNLRETERRYEEQATARIAQEQRARYAQEEPNQFGMETMCRARFPPTLEEDMLPQDLTKRKRTDDDRPRAKKPRFHTAALKTLIDDPPFIGGPVRVAGRPLPFTRSEQLEMPHGGLPEVRYPVEPLAVRGDAAINVVERVADAAERWGVVGLRSRYELPRGAVEALAAVADSEASGLPREPRRWGV